MRNLDVVFKWLAIIFLPLVVVNLQAQELNLPDSISIRVKPSYDSVKQFHRMLFGENYRKSYAQETKVPILRLSKISGGLKPTERGGGNQSKSLRLVDKVGVEWVLRSVEKYPEVLLPQHLRNTIAKDIIKDNMVSQHPFSALVVADLAEAAGIPHSSPVIGWVLPDPNFGEFAPDFVNSLCLLELREPLGNSDNTLKMYAKLTSNHDISFDASLYLKARALDVLIGDWDRHDDQWRWKLLKSKTGAVYVPVPRDRDQVFFRSDGLVQRFAQSSWLLPMMQGYERDIQNINWFLWEGRELNSRFFANMSEQEWNAAIEDFCAKITDKVLETAVSRLPMPDRQLRSQELLTQLKRRRAALPTLMKTYFHFYHKIIDIEVSNKDERIEISDTTSHALHVKITKGNHQDAVLFDKVFDPKLTKEIRVYMHDGSDSLIINNKSSAIKLRVIGGDGNKVYDIMEAQRPVLLYGKTTNATYMGTAIHKLNKKLSNDSAHVSYLAKDLYRRSFTFLNAGYNVDDGIMLGLSYRIKSPGFRKTPYRDIQAFSFLYSFGTAAYKFNYRGEWTKAIGNADFVISAMANAPSNTQNFFGYGNNTKYDTSIDKVSYFRARFDYYQFDPALRWNSNKSTFSLGPSFQYYHYDADGNVGRFIEKADQLHSYDSLTIAKNKMHLGLIGSFVNDSRDHELLPKRGSLFMAKLMAYEGISRYSGSFVQLNLSFACYKKLDAKGSLVIANRIGGGVTTGRPNFFQSQFLGGQGNLLGFRQFRFAGKHSVYNNLELRLKLGNFVNYIVPGEVGVMGLYDLGRVWSPNEQSNKIHQGYGGGIYFAPASLTIFRAVAVHSKEGWYPYLALGFRY